MTSNETRLTVAIAYLIISEGISFNIYQKPRFKKVLDLERTFSKCYQFPNRKLTSKDVLYVIRDQNMERNLSLIKKESDIFGLLFLDDGATISRIPLLNILVSGKNLPISVLELVGCHGHLVDGGEKDGTFICNRFLEHTRKIDPRKPITDGVMFYGASNVQLAGELLKIHYQNISVMLGVEHTVSLFFNDVSEIPVVYCLMSCNHLIHNWDFGNIIEK